MVSNREPYVHSSTSDGIACHAPASGMTMALDPVMRASGGTWIAAGTGDADPRTVDDHDRLRVPPFDPRYTLRRVWLSKQEEYAYYYGYANEGLWPLCHIVHVRPVFRLADWEIYQQVNQRFADVVCEELGDDPGFVFIQDYHLALLSRLIKERRPDVIVAQFWHIPWPNPETFRVCPQAKDLLLGLLGNDILGFHIRYHGINFLQTVDRFLEVRTDWENMSATKDGRETLVRAYPISIDFERIQELATSREVRERAEALRRDPRFEGMRVAVGVERMDYTKGIVERLEAVDLLLERHPEYRRRFVLLQLGPISRIKIDKYKEYNDLVYRTIVRVNDRWGDADWQPVHLRTVLLDLAEIVSYFQASDLCIVNAIHDGMNLVAKEYVASRTDEDGVLILSRFTGSSRELKEALLVHPYDIDELADALHRALCLDPGEKAARMRRMREVVRRNNVYRWAGTIVQDMRRLL
ncbi:MAG: trehalose-6-phosphate synthase [Deltaproteobacteria bacterium]|nr:trehalose-6-phosphate synthase [Deltaproteobacteria bacterium]